MHRGVMCHLLIVLLTVSMVAGCGTTRPRTPGLACTALDPGLRLSQEFVAQGHALQSAHILVKTLNRNRHRAEPLSLVLVDRQDRVVARSSQSVPVGYKGWVAFDFPAPGVALTRGDRYFLRVAGSRNLPFGWYQRRNFYAQGSAYHNGIARPGLDWYFKLVWATDPAPSRPDLSQLRPDQRHATVQAAAL